MVPTETSNKNKKNVITVALVQLKVFDGDKKTNLSRYRKLLVTNMAKLEHPPVDIIVLPELFDTGYAYEKYSTLAEEVGHGISFKSLQETAIKYNSYVIAGYLEKYKEKFFDSVMILNRRGELVANYRKTHLFQSEREHFSEGNTFALIETDFGRIGVAICYELRFPEVARLLTLKGAKIIFYPAAWPIPRIEHWKILGAARAIENQVFIVLVNRVGAGTLYHYFGESMVIDPWGDIIAGAGEFERVVFAKIEFAFINKSRELITSLKDRRSDLYIF